MNKGFPTQTKGTRIWSAFFLWAVLAFSAAQDLPIRIEVHSQASNTVPNALLRAWKAGQDGNLTEAEKQYQRILDRHPHHRDACLGLASVFMKQGKLSDAAHQYRHLLWLDGSDTEALAGLFIIAPGHLNHQTEARLRQQTSSAAFLLLGQHYARQARWAEAQERYLLALSLDPKNPDLVFNLAISLDHMQQTQLACDYYESAIVLAVRRPAVFDQEVAKKRLTVLKQSLQTRSQP